MLPRFFLVVVLCHRDELYPMPYSSIDWNAARSQIAKEDLYYPHPLVQVCLHTGADMLALWQSTQFCAV